MRIFGTWTRFVDPFFRNKIAKQNYGTSITHKD